MICDLYRAVIVERWTPGAPVPAEASAHLERCRECRSWFAAFADGLAWSEADAEALIATVLARTTGGACGRVRELLAGRPDSALADIDVNLVGAHLTSCDACSELSAVLDAAQADLASLATLEPGPGFAERVIAQTSRKALHPQSWEPASFAQAQDKSAGARPKLAEASFHIRLRSRITPSVLSGRLAEARLVWRRLVSRPRFAWEVAYVATLCWLVFFGPSVSALDWTTAKVATVAREHVPSKLDALGDALGEWRSTVTSELGTASAAIEARRVSWVESAVIEFEKSVAWAQQAAAALLDGVEAAVRATAVWLADLFGGLAADSTEPRQDAARSRQ